MAFRRRGASPGLGRRIGFCLAIGLPIQAPIVAQSPPVEADILGRWAGSVVLPGGELAFSVTFESVDGALTATMDIPSQALDLPLVEVSYEDGRAHFELQASIGLAVWDGAREGDTISGDFKQGGAVGTFTVERSDVEEPGWLPEQPVPYREEEIEFDNGDVHFEGTLTLPQGDGPFPAAVMITGSGAQNRDELLLGFPIFHVIADHLSRRGIAVYRYDDRGVGGSTGSVAQSTTSDFADDVLAAIARISAHPEIDAERVGLIGHSEGGVVAPLAASRSDAVKFAVLIAGTSVTGAEIIYEQAAAIARAAEASEDDIAWTTAFQRRLFAAMEAGEDLDAYREELEIAVRDGLDRMTEEQRAPISDIDEWVATQVSQQIDQLQVPWFKYFLTYDPAVALRQTRVPVLALFGELDLQVLPSQNRGPMAEALGGNPDVTIRVLPRANHLFQEATTGSPAEYGLLEKTFVDGFLDGITDWILTRYGG